MISTYFRSSYMANLDFCEMQTFLNYNLGIERKAGLKAAQGTCVHKVLECLANLKKEHQEDKNVLKIDDKAVGEFSTKRESLLDKKTVNSLIDRSFEHYSTKEGNNFNKRQYLEIEQWAWTPLLNLGGLFDPRNRNIIEAEPHFDITLEQDWAAYEYKVGDMTIEGKLAIRGTIDLVTKVDDETIEIIDWKTGARKNWATGEEKTYDKLCKDNQLMLYHYAASKLYPWAKNIIVTIYWIKDGGPFTISFDGETKTEMEKILKKKFEYVKKVKVPRMCSPSQTDFRCTKICDYYKNNWPGTNMNICKFIHEKIKKHGIDYVQENFQNPNHSIHNYQSPGE